MAQAENALGWPSDTLSRAIERNAALQELVARSVALVEARQERVLLEADNYVVSSRPLNEQTSPPSEIVLRISDGNDNAIFTAIRSEISGLLRQNRRGNVDDVAPHYTQLPDVYTVVLPDGVTLEQVQLDRLQAMSEFLKSDEGVGMVLRIQGEGIDEEAELYQQTAGLFEPDLPLNRGDYLRLDDGGSLADPGASGWFAERYATTLENIQANDEFTGSNPGVADPNLVLETYREDHPEEVARLQSKHQHIIRALEAG